MNYIKHKIQKQGMYKIGLDRIQEAVVSSHFMHDMNRNIDFDLYNDEYFCNKTIRVDERVIFDKLIPYILHSSNIFYKNRAIAAKARAIFNYKKYGLNFPTEVGLSHFITEVMFDRQYLKGPRDNCSREVLCAQVEENINNNCPIKMVIPALPFKLSSPLKTRGQLPDLGEVNFILGLFEIIKTIEYIYREKEPRLNKVLAEFTILCDGHRFNEFLNEQDQIIQKYQISLNQWIKILRLDDYIKIIDYQNLLQNALPENLREKKALIRQSVIREYSKIFWPIFDPCNMAKTIDLAINFEPDPEQSNPEGRFIPLFKSLVYIFNYIVLRQYVENSGEDYKQIYRELTRHILEPYTELSNIEVHEISKALDNDIKAIRDKNKLKEYLRRVMLKQVWGATIQYMAEIKSDRDLEREPIMACLPGHIRWTIHAKSGQLAVLTATALGDPVQAWNGIGVFKQTKKGKIKLYTLPVLALEGNGAIPVIVNYDKSNINLLAELISDEQPLFYIFPDIQFKDINEFLIKVKYKLIRKRKL